MKQLTAFWQSFRKDGDDEKKGRDKLLLVVLAGLLLLVIVWPVSGSNEQREEGKAEVSDARTDTTEDYAAVMEQRLKTILENVDGAGKVQVMITVKGTAEQVVEKDQSYSESRSTQTADESSSSVSDSISRSESTVYSNSSGGSPYVVKEMQPEVEGILVVAEGAGDEAVVNEITYAVQVLFDVPVHKIKVVKMSSQ